MVEPLLLGHDQAPDPVVVTALRREVGTQLMEQKKRFRASGHVLTPEDERQLASTLIGEVVRAHAGRELGERSIVVRDDQQDVLRRAVFAAMFQADRFQRLLDDQDLENINIIGDKTFVRFGDGRPKEQRPPVAGSDEELIGMVRKLATYVGLSSRPWDQQNPFLRLRLPDGSRLGAIGWVCDRPTISIRRNRHPRITLDQLVSFGTCSQEVADYLRSAVVSGLTIVVAGDQSAGKTTVLRSLIREIPSDERIFTIEESLELDVDAMGTHEDVVALEARASYGETDGSVTQADLVRATLIQDANRIIVGECRGGAEIVALLNATMGGAGGSLTTIHCKHVKGVFNRIAAFATQSREADLSAETAHLMASDALEIIVYVRALWSRDANGRRRIVGRVISDIDEVSGFNGKIATSSSVFAYDPRTRQAVRTPAASRWADLLADNGYVAAKYHGSSWGK